MASVFADRSWIDSPRPEVWAKLADLEGLPAWASQVEEVAVEGPPGEDARRTWTLDDGAHLDERITGWEPERNLRSSIRSSDLELHEASLSWTLHDEPDGGTIVELKGRFEEGSEGAGRLRDLVRSLVRDMTGADPDKV